MSPIVLKKQTSQGDVFQATFFPEMGMNLASFKKNQIEIIDQTTAPQFQERYAGLGALIGPHFHRRQKAILPKIADPSLFPHLARVQRLGIDDPFSHGIARYAPWNYTATEHEISASLSGKDLWNGMSLAALEGQNFIMHYVATLTDEGLNIAMDVVSDTDSLVGIHYYYNLPEKCGKVISSVQPEFIDLDRNRKPIPSHWNYNDQHQLTFDLENEADYTFFPFPNTCKGSIILELGNYQLITTYESPSEENAWQLYHPKGASFVCIEPVSSQDPRHPNLTVSSLKISLSLLDT